MGSSQSSSIPPQQIVMNYILGIPVGHMISAAAEIGVFRELANGPRTAGHIAQLAGTLPEATYRLMRALTTVGLLTEDPNHTFALTEVGECLVPGRPGSFDALAKMNGASWMAPVFGELLHSLRSGESAFLKLHGKGLFEWLPENPHAQELFGHGMSTFSAVEVEFVLAAYDFSSAGHVVDIGGGHGLLLSKILGSVPAARGTLFDLPEVADRAKAKFIDASIRERCEVVGGDFFDSVPSGGDLYLLKHILHDWDDARADRILASVASAMPPGSRLLVIEQGVTEPGTPSPGKIMDVVMLLLLDGGRERTTKEFAALFDRNGLRFEREIRTGGPITLYEG
ncbi:MAG TPA: methyltransferase, partial [Polyangiaceae bacterium]